MKRILTVLSLLTISTCIAGNNHHYHQESRPKIIIEKPTDNRHYHGQSHSYQNRSENRVIIVPVPSHSARKKPVIIVRPR